MVLLLKMANLSVNTRLFEKESNKSFDFLSNILLKLIYYIRTTLSIDKKRKNS